MKRPGFSFRLFALRASFAVLGLLAPRAGAKLAYRLWFATFRSREPERERRQREKAQSSWLEHAHGRIAVYHWGRADGPLVLCMHGWNGRAAQLGRIIEALVKDGYRVVAFDAPGHGRSDRQSTTIFQIAEVLKSIVDKEGMPKLMVGHSFGCMILAYVLRRYALKPDKLIFISAPTSTRYLIDQFAQMLRIPPRIMGIFHAMLQQEFGDDIYEAISLEQNIRGSQIPVLVIHDKVDRAVSWRNSERIAEAADAAQVLYTEGLGHRRVLRDSNVIKRITSFVRETENEQ